MLMHKIESFRDAHRVLLMSKLHIHKSILAAALYRPLPCRSWRPQLITMVTYFTHTSAERWLKRGKFQRNSNLVP
jgi:hypothetical protein